MPKDPHAKLWSHVSTLESETLKDWRAANRPTQPLEVAAANDLRSIETTVKRYRGGNVSVTVCILGMREDWNYTSYYRLQRAGNKLFVVQYEASTTGEGSSSNGKAKPVG